MSGQAVNPGNGVPTSYDAATWPKQVRVAHLYVDLRAGRAEVVKTIGGATLKPDIPLDQLALFLNDHVAGGIRCVTVISSNCAEEELLRALDETTVPGRLSCAWGVAFTNSFHLPWADIARIFDGRKLRGEWMWFGGLQLPSDDASKFLELPAIRDCHKLIFDLYTAQFSEPSTSPPRFNNTALMEWLKWSGERRLELASDYLSTDFDNFLGTLKQDFNDAEEVHSYTVMINLRPNFHPPEQQDEALSNRFNETMRIEYGPNQQVMQRIGGNAFVTVFVKRSPPPS